MAEAVMSVGGDGGPLVALQLSAASVWRGAEDFENSLMNGGTVETDYDVICDCSEAGETTVIHRYDRDMLVLWDSEFTVMRLDSALLALPSDTVVLTMAYDENDLPEILPSIVARVAEGGPDRSLSFDVVETTLRLQVGADGATSYDYATLDIPIPPGRKRCDVYVVKYDSLQDEVVVIREWAE